MTETEVSPFVGKCVAVYLDTGDIFQGMLRLSNDIYEIDAGGSQTAVDNAAAIDHIEMLQM